VGAGMLTSTGSANNRGFTLIELLIVMTILSILVGIVILSVGNVFVRARDSAYITVKHQVQTAVVAYAMGDLGDYPLTGNTTVINGKTLGILDICALIIYNNPSGLLREIPDGFISYTENDNCDSIEYTCSCEALAHYIWAINVNGDVFSTCINTSLNGGGCAASAQDGFQNVWP
jgi:prepilin-type N-terminal cleavage/methylation domain-containing protein